MTVVVEETLFVGVMLNFFILKLVAKIKRVKTRAALFSSLVGASVSLFQPLFVMHLAIKLLLMVFTLLLMLCISFKFVSLKNFGVLFAVFLLATFVLGGGVYALKSLVGGFPVFVVSFIGGAVYLLCVVIHKVIFSGERIRQFAYKVSIKDGDKSFSEEGYLDSGNILYDRVSGKPIMLVNFEVFSKLYNISLANFLMRRYDLSSIKNGHFIDIQSIGRGGKMLVFTVDEVEIDGKIVKNASVGLSFSGFEKSFGKPILLHAEMV